MEREIWRNALQEQIKDLSPDQFDAVTMQVFRYQAEYNPIYRRFLGMFSLDPDQVAEIDQIPFLPIEAFKHNIVKTGEWKEEQVFQSSGAIKSHHYMRSLKDYHRGCVETLEQLMGPIEGFEIFGLLPHYLEAGQSSLVSMVAAFMRRTGQSEEHFYLRDFAGLANALRSNQGNHKTILFGVTYALVDFALAHRSEIPKNTIVVETGGMKGRKDEWEKETLHQFLRAELGVEQIWGEYGMTELSSQAYAANGKLMKPAQTLRVYVKEMNDPFTQVKKNKVGVVHLVDLSNLDTCSFIASADLGIDRGLAGFEIVGRLQDSDLRGCQLLYL